MFSELGTDVENRLCSSTFESSFMFIKVLFTLQSQKIAVQTLGDTKDKIELIFFFFRVLIKSFDGFLLAGSKIRIH